MKSQEKPTSSLWTLAGIGLIILSFLIFLLAAWMVLAVVPAAVYGNRTPLMDRISITERVPHSKSLGTELEAKLIEMRLRLGLLGCWNASVSMVKEREIVILTLTCSEGGR